MTKDNIKAFLEEKPGYLKVSADRLSERLNCSVETCAAALTEMRVEMKGSDFDVDNANESVITEFQEFLDNNGIAPTDVASVKFWQTMSGQQRFSVVTKNEGRNISEIKKEIEDFAAIYSPDVPQVLRYNTLSDPIVYEISLPDVHYGKQHGFTLKEIEQQFLGVVRDLVTKADGLDIERFLLPIGNDGMNSEGMRRTTTKGTPQDESADWKETFRGYWTLMVTAIDYLKERAPVDVVVVSGNHDYERMFYAGDVIAGWYRNDGNVTVDNSEEPRKYYEYGTNMIMFTHGDNEKAAEMPLIMATEQPEMFARSTHREAHCGHFHKEMVNEYRGVKVRFIPSICPNDEWHKRMGYQAKRTGQAYIWNKKAGLGGYLQSNL